MSTEPTPEVAALQARVAVLEKKARRSWLRYALLGALGVLVLNMLIAVSTSPPRPVSAGWVTEPGGWSVGPPVGPLPPAR
jgi:hypothetical protein